MAKDFISKDSHGARKIYDEYSKSQRSRKISPEFEELLNLSDEDRCFRLKVVGSKTIEDLLMAIEKCNITPVPGGWNKTLNSALIYANKKQVEKLIKRDEVKYIRYVESDVCEM